MNSFISFLKRNKKRPFLKKEMNNLGYFDEITEVPDFSKIHRYDYESITRIIEGDVPSPRVKAMLDKLIPAPIVEPIVEPIEFTIIDSDSLEEPVVLVDCDGTCHKKYRMKELLSVDGISLLCTECLATHEELEAILYDDDDDYDEDDDDYE
jgi:hypothetical protein